MGRAGLRREDVTLSTEVLWRRGILILLLAALFLRGKVLYMLLYTLIGVYFLSRYVASRSFGALQISRSLSVDHAFVGETVAVTVEVYNPTRLPVIWLLASDETTHQLSVTSPKRAVLSLRPRQRASWTYQVAARRRGLHIIGPLHLEAGDAFGLSHLRGQAPVQSHLVVYPRIYALRELGLPSSLPFGEVQTRTRFFDDPAHTIGTRPYQPGDPYKSIHWKVTAKAGALHVKEYQPTISVESLIYLNLNEGEYEVHLLEYYSELAIEAAASLAYALGTNRQSVGLVTNGKMPGGAERRLLFVPPRKGSAGVMEILEVLARIECATSISLPELLTETSSRLNWGATLLLITPVDSPRLVEKLLALRRQGFNLIVILVGFDPLHREYLHRPLAPGITFYHIQSPSQLENLAIAAG